MKAIPREQKPAVLAFNFENERLESLQSICDGLNIALTTVSAKETPEAFTLSLGDLLNGGNISVSDTLDETMKLAMSAMAFPEEMFVLANMQESVLDAFLVETRKNDLWIPLKAVATPTNAKWKPMALKCELMEEHAAMQAAIEAQKAKAEKAGLNIIEQMNNNG